MNQVTERQDTEQQATERRDPDKQMGDTGDARRATAEQRALDELTRKALGCSPPLWREAMELTRVEGDKASAARHRVMEAYETWRGEVLAGAERGGDLSTRELAALIGSSTDYIAQLKIRGQITWSAKRALKVGASGEEESDGADGTDGEEGESGESGGSPRVFVYRVGDVERLFERSEGWLNGGALANGSQGTKGPLAHLFVKWLREKGYPSTGTGTGTDGTNVTEGESTHG